VRRWICAALCFAWTGCGPSVRQLVADKHYREAICAADGGGRDTRMLVEEALWSDLDLHLHLQPVPDEALARVVGDDAARISDRALFVRILLRTNVVPVDGLQLKASLEREEGTSGGAAVSWEALSWATGEPLPPKQEYETYATAANVRRGLAAIPTFGLSLLFSPFQRERRIGDAPLEVHRRTAPLATRLHGEMAYHGCRELAPPGSAGLGKACTGFLVVDRSVDEPLSVRVELTVGAEKEPRRLRHEGRCTVSRTIRIPVGRPAELAKGEGAASGRRMLRLPEPARQSPSGAARRAGR
jgi:hypothetical protein